MITRHTGMMRGTLVVGVRRMLISILIPIFGIPLNELGGRQILQTTATEATTDIDLGHQSSIMTHKGILLGHQSSIMTHKDILLGHQSSIMTHQGIDLGHPVNVVRLALLTDQLFMFLSLSLSCHFSASLLTFLVTPHLVQLDTKCC